MSHNNTIQSFTITESIIKSPSLTWKATEGFVFTLIEVFTDVVRELGSNFTWCGVYFSEESRINKEQLIDIRE
jgi:hypothetical protein